MEFYCCCSPNVRTRVVTLVNQWRWNATMPRNEGTSLGPQHEQHPNTAQRLLHCGEIQAIIDRLNEAGTNMESHFLANRLQRLSSGSGQRTHAAQQDDSATFGLMHCKKRRARVAMILFWQVLWMELVARELDSFARELARNRKSCTGVAATKGVTLASRQGGVFVTTPCLSRLGKPTRAEPRARPLFWGRRPRAGAARRCARCAESVARIRHRSRLDAGAVIRARTAKRPPLRAAGA
jgi:hypothetical protein